VRAQRHLDAVGNARGAHRIKRHVDVRVNLADLEVHAAEVNRVGEHFLDGLAGGDVAQIGFGTVGRKGAVGLQHAGLLDWNSTQSGQV